MAGRRRGPAPAAPGLSGGPGAAPGPGPGAGAGAGHGVSAAPPPAMNGAAPPPLLEPKERVLKLGETFEKQPRCAFHTVRCERPGARLGPRGTGGGSGEGHGAGGGALGDSGARGVGPETSPKRRTPAAGAARRRAHPQGGVWAAQPQLPQPDPIAEGLQRVPVLLVLNAGLRGGLTGAEQRGSSSFQELLTA